MKHLKKFAALVLTAAIAISCMPGMMVFAKGNDWMDGDTPAEYENRVKTSADMVFSPTVQTNFHAPGVKALIPSSPKGLFDLVTGVNTSIYADAKSVVYVVDNEGYGDLAKAALGNTMTALGATRVSSLTLNLFKYEGCAYKPVTATPLQLEFMVQIPKSVRANTRDFAMLRINADGSVSVLPDLDSDPITMTFTTDYFAINNVYALVYAPKGVFEAFKPVVINPATGGPVVINPSTGLPMTF